MHDIRVLLVQPPLMVDPKQGRKRNVFLSGVEIPLGLLYLASYLSEAAVPNDLLDMRVCSYPFETLKMKLRKFQPHLVGVTAFSCEIQGAYEVVRLAKSIDNSIITVIGGIHASALPSQTLRECEMCNAVVFGEGEQTLVEIVNNLRSGSWMSGIEGVAFRDEGAIVMNEPRSMITDLDALPFPDRSRINIGKYVPNPITGNYRTLPTTGIMAGRGCPYGCFHCSKGVWGQTIRFRSARNIFEEMQACVTKYGIHDFRFFDDTMTLPHGPMTELCQLLIESRLCISFNCYGRIDNLTEDLLKLMKRAGCYHIKYGIEFGSERALQLSNRKTTLDQAKHAVAMTKRLGITVKGNFMMGIPGETEQDFEKTIEFAKELSPDLASFGLFTLFPGSRFYRDIVEFGNGQLADSILPKETVIRYITRAYREFYFRRSYLIQRIKSVIKDPVGWILEMRRLLRGALTLSVFFIKRMLNLV